MLKKKKKEDIENPEGLNEIIDENNQDAEQAELAENAPSPASENAVIAARGSCGPARYEW